ncbi:MAG: nucleotidyl transferase AbiEii/AbiGii toxin family protein [Gemmatimonadaceae bacterium]
MTQLPARATPPSVGKLEKYVLAYANAAGTAVGRVRHWISFMILSGALDRASARAAAPRFVVKGGVALELRLPGRARATGDLDIVAVCNEEDLVVALDDAMREPYHDCTFTRRADTHPLGDKGVRVWVQIAYRSQRWATVQVDLARPDGTDTETERLPGIPLSAFGLTGPADVVCLSLRYHIAQKFHGMTKVPHSGGENDRFRDAVDLLLLRELVDDEALPSIRVACEETFRIRAEHQWPPTMALPRSWREPFAAMSRNIGVAETNLDVAESALRSLLDRIAVA